MCYIKESTLIKTHSSIDIFVSYIGETLPVLWYLPEVKSDVMNSHVLHVISKEMYTWASTLNNITDYIKPDDFIFICNLLTISKYSVTVNDWY